MGARVRKRTGHDIVVIGCSAGGVETLPKLFSKIPKNIGAAFFVAMHVGAASRSFLPKIIGRSTHLTVQQAETGQPITPGHIYVAPPDFHLLVNGGKVILNHGPKENRHRPAIDPLFRSAAEHHGARVIGVILTGALDDGTAGLQAVKQCGGIAVVQHPEDALVPGMPTSALQFVDVDYCVRLAPLPALLRRIIKSPAGKPQAAGCHQQQKLASLRDTMTIKQMEENYGAPSALVCPECNGPIWETSEGKVTQFRCLVGHAFSPESFAAEEAVAVERALWVAVKTLQERASLLRNLSDRAYSLDQTITGSNFRQQSRENEEHAEVIRGILKRFTNETE